MTKECNIVFELGMTWVYRESKSYTVYINNLTHATSDSSYSLTNDGLSIAIERCKYLNRNNH